ncbi:MAG: hypothetical protein KGJ23_14925 [Euryarchaeota archaeon]|nr:hypothetical protein [Euryarchaeota archaeon]MDE1837893.1 hypothetical protein [Euryarchaeota archaeon]MDE1881303.1 hypothetical protein [Euryarchaeota archaeon]MDE2046239.1 hypothetical protein [Thermoplasmata archaeon]
MGQEGTPTSPGGPRPGPRGPSPRRVLLLGFGHVGRAVAERLLEEGHGDPDFPWRVVGIVDSRGALIDEAGVDLRAALSSKTTAGRLEGPTWRDWDALQALDELRPEVVVEVSVADPVRGEPGTTHVLAALDAGADVVASNKGPFALRHREVLAAVARTGRRVRYGTTVGGIVPILETLVERLPTAEVTQVRAVLNGTTQFVLDRIAQGASFDDAVGEARRTGLAEPDPSWDLDGHDAALKAAILHNALFTPPITAAEVPRDPLGPDLIPRLQKLRSEGKGVAFVTTVRAGSAEVRCEEVRAGSPWSEGGPANVFEISTRRVGTLLLQGRGAGPQATATGVLADLTSLEALSGHDGPRLRGSAWIERSQWPPRPPVERDTTPVTHDFVHPAVRASWSVPRPPPTLPSAAAAEAFEEVRPW